MSDNLYKILQINSNSSQEDIKKAYRKLAMKWHPDKNINNKINAEKKFKEINKAYDILSDPQKKKKYDMYGEEGLDNNYSNFTTFNNPENVFNHFFGKENNFFNNFEQKQNHYSKPVSNTINIDVYVTLEELYTGIIKKLKITRKIYNTPISFKKEKEIINLNIKKGYKSGTKITFKRKGNQIYNMLPGNICFIIKEKKHIIFSRENNNLIVNKEIDLKEALVNYLIEIPFLDNTSYIREKIGNNLVIYPGYKHIITGKGMPDSKTGKYGNLYIYFKIIFPKKLSQYQKKLIKSIL